MCSIFPCRNLDASVWLSKEQLQIKIIEDITDKQYEDFVAMMNRLLQHPYSHHCKEFIMQYRQSLKIQQKDREIVEAKIGEDGRKYVTSYGNLKLNGNIHGIHCVHNSLVECRFKSCVANVTVISPGTYLSY